MNIMNIPRFTWQARQAQRLDPVENMQSRVPVKLQAERRDFHGIN
jgi:hypothetical protein